MSQRDMRRLRRDLTMTPVQFSAFMAELLAHARAAIPPSREIIVEIHAPPPRTRRYRIITVALTPLGSARVH